MKLYTLDMAHCSFDNFWLIGAATPFSKVPFMRTDRGFVL